MESDFSNLEIGSTVEITGFREVEDNRTALAQLQSLGLVVGTTFTLIRRAPLGDPAQISVRGYNLSLPNRIGKLLELSQVSS